MVRMSEMPNPAPTAAQRLGRPPKTTLAEVAATALRLIDTEGLEALTMRRLADEAGISVITLYKYARTKDEILEHVAVLALRPFQVQPDPTMPWREQLFRVLSDAARYFRAHPAAAELLTLKTPLKSPDVDQFREGLLGILLRGGMPHQRAVDILITLGAYVVGFVTVETTRAQRATDLQEHISTLARDAAPTLTEDPAAWVRPVPEETFERGLRLLIDGLSGEPDLASDFHVK